MANFNIAIGPLLKREGGFVNDPDDRGRATNMGITQATLSTHLGRSASEDDVRNLTAATATAIYKKLYADPIRFDEFRSQEVAEFLLDFAVHSGTVTAVKEVQAYLGLSADGIVGPNTLGYINSRNPMLVLEQMRTARYSYFCRCVDAWADSGGKRGVHPKYGAGFDNRFRSIQIPGAK